MALQMVILGVNCTTYAYPESQIFGTLLPALSASNYNQIHTAHSIHSNVWCLVSSSSSWLLIFLKAFISPGISQVE